MIEDACRGIDTQGSLAAAWTSMEKAGVKRIQSTDSGVRGLTCPFCVSTHPNTVAPLPPHSVVRPLQSS